MGADTIRFVLDGQVETVVGPDPTATLLDHLRNRMARTGTKEGCAEGDCGACTVLVGTADAGFATLTWRAVNSCILFLPMLDGKALMTVESLGGPAAPTPLQRTMAGNGASQCGFCTPGFVMSLTGRAMGAAGAELPVADVIAGNLCRCTGYGPILAAGEAHGPGSQPHDDAPVLAALAGLATPQGPRGTFGTRHWAVPRDAAELAGILAEAPETRLIAGATDVGLWVTKGLRVLDRVAFVGDIAELQAIAEDDAGLTLGAGVRYADAHGAMARLHPALGEVVRRIGGLQVRNAGTVGGNIANGSPIGDGPPALIALGTALTLESTAGRRTIALEDYFLDYGKQDRRAGEFVASVQVPRPAPGAVVHMSKLSRRFDSDISAVLGAAMLSVDAGTITAARVAFGGMAATPRRAAAVEATLVGQPFAEATIAAAVSALPRDFTPLDDVRGSAAYRLQAAGAVLWRLWHESRGEPVSVLESAAHG